MLVAEDNAVNRLVVQHMLQKSGHEVSLVVTGRQAVEAALTGAFDVVLMDVQMPEMNGLEATAAIRAHETGRRLPIIGITAHALRGDRERCLEAGHGRLPAQARSPPPARPGAGAHGAGS